MNKHVYLYIYVLIYKTETMKRVMPDMEAHTNRDDEEGDACHGNLYKVAKQAISP